MDPITYPVRAFARAQKISPTRLYELIDKGEIESVLIGNRRHIVVASYRSMIERRCAEQDGTKLPSSNPKVKAREAAASPQRATNRGSGNEVQTVLGASRKPASAAESAVAAGLAVGSGQACARSEWKV